MCADDNISCTDYSIGSFKYSVEMMKFWIKVADNICFMLHGDYKEINIETYTLVLNPTFSCILTC